MMKSELELLALIDNDEATVFKSFDIITLNSTAGLKHN